MKLLIILIAIYLCWNCNADKNIFLRLLYTLTASMFSGFYIIFYSIYRILLNNNCSNRFKDLTLI